jgi:hypothetical protein
MARLGFKSLHVRVWKIIKSAEGWRCAYLPGFGGGRTAYPTVPAVTAPKSATSIAADKVVDAGKKRKKTTGLPPSPSGMLLEEDTATKTGVLTNAQSY